jgi:rsbT antagonist protein RsbS
MPSAERWAHGASEPEVRRVPIIAIDSVLLVSIQASLTDGEVRRLRADVGERLSQRGWRGLVIDANGVDTMDSFITRSLRDLAVGARLMGVETVVCGLRPDVVDALVEMGLDLVGVQTTTSLDRALARLQGSRRG